MDAPKLRFKNFNESYVGIPLEQIAEVGRGKSRHRPRNDSRLYGDVIPFIQTGDVKHSQMYINSFNEMYSEFGVKQSKIWNEGTLCVTIAANIAETAILNIKACFPDSIIGITVKDNIMNAVYLKLLFDNIKDRLSEQSEGVAQSNMNLEKIKKIIFKIPSIEEQVKISSFFLSLEKKIQLQQEKIDLLKKQKRGYMQQIFSQNLRFKDKHGDYYPNWESKKLNQYLAVNIKLNKNLLYNVNDVLSVSGEYGVVNQIEFQGRSFAGANLEKYKIADIGDIIYTKSPLKDNPYGIIKANLYKPGIVSTLYAVYTVIEESCLPAFIHYYFESKETVNNYLRPIISKGAKNTINISDTAALENTVCFPCLEEQIKIANFLDTFDKKIAHETTKLTQLNFQKQYFMQQMFI